jgi:hypothetical protein
MRGSIVLWLAVVAALACPPPAAGAEPAGGASPARPDPPAASLPPLPGGALPDSSPFQRFLACDVPPADGFDFPVGDANGWGAYRDARDGRRRVGWHVYIRFGQRYKYGLHPGEDWNGAGAGNADAGQPVVAVAAGRVVFAAAVEPAGGVVVIQHLFYENHRKRRIRSVYKHLDALRVTAGQTVARRQPIGSIGRGSDDRYLAHLHFELRWDESLAPTYWPSAHGKSLAWIQQRYAPPSAFIRGHRQLFVPQHEHDLLLVHRASRRLRHYRRGALAAEYPIGYGRPSGAEVRAGFDRPPLGMYFVVDLRRSTGLALNHPNAFDAARGERRGLVLPQQQARIASAWRARRATPRDCLLTRGLGFSGWIRRWDPDAPRQLGWGSLLMHGRHLEALLQRVTAGTMVVLF